MRLVAHILLELAEFAAIMAGALGLVVILVGVLT